MINRVGLDDVFAVVDNSRSTSPLLVSGQTFGDYVDSYGFIDDAGSNLSETLTDRILTYAVMQRYGVSSNDLFESFTSLDYEKQVNGGVIGLVSGELSLTEITEVMSLSRNLHAYITPSLIDLSRLDDMVDRIVNALMLNDKNTRGVPTYMAKVNVEACGFKNIAMPVKLGRRSFFLAITTSKTDVHNNVFWRTLVHYLYYYRLNSMSDFNSQMQSQILKADRCICIYNARLGRFYLYSIRDLSGADLKKAFKYKQKLDMIITGKFEY